jgi:hypothetical protein
MLSANSYSGLHVRVHEYATLLGVALALNHVCFDRYFKDEVQRAALQKLNQKRQWYQQQLESERLKSKGSVPKHVPGQVGTGTFRAWI